MMEAPPSAAEQVRTQEIAEEFRRRGYDVVLTPSPQQLPDFLAGYQPDLIARRGDENVVIEVKSRRSLATDPKARELARLLQSQPGWRFELVLVRESDPFAGAHSFERGEILGRIQEAERLHAAGSTEAALLLAWAAAEAAVRLLLEEEGIALQRLTPAHVLKQAVSEGVIGRDEYKLLTGAMQHQNALAHGFRIADRDPAIVQELIDMTRNLLGIESAQPAA